MAYQLRVQLSAKSTSSSNVVDEVFQSFLVDELEDGIEFGTLVVVVVLLELWPLTLGFLLVYKERLVNKVVHTFFHGEVVEFLRKLASLDELLHLCSILALHALSVGWVLSLQEQSEKLKHGLLKREGRVL